MKHSPAFLQLVADAKRQIREVTTDEVSSMLERGERFHLVDVREDGEWLKGRLPSATHICKGIIERDIESAIPDRNAPIVLYCGGGFRSALAAESLQKMGYKNVASMTGGWRDWTAAGLAVEKGAS